MSLNIHAFCQNSKYVQLDKEISGLRQAEGISRFGESPY